MRVVFGLVLILGIGLAGLAVYLVQGYVSTYQAALEEERKNAPETIPLTKVFVAKHALKYGQLLTKEDVRVVKWPTNAIPAGSFIHDPTDETLVALFPENGETRYVLRAMEQDEALLAVKLTEPGEDAGLTSRLDKGMRAFAIKVDVASGVSGFLRPGDAVDVYWTGRVEIDGERREVTKLIEQTVKLIAIDQTANGDSVETMVARTVTVAASPQQVAALAQAQSTGDLTLALVGNEDDTEIGVVAVDQQSLLGITPEQKKADIQEKVCTIRTRKGSEVLEIPIPCTN